jgi:hypothetical protein
MSLYQNADIIISRHLINLVEMWWFKCFGTTVALHSLKRKAAH